MENQQNSEESIKQQTSLNLPREEIEINETKKDDIFQEEIFTSVDKNNESDQQWELDFLPEEVENLTSKSLATGEFRKLFQSIQDGLNSIKENFNQWQIQIGMGNQLQMENTKILNLRSSIKKVVQWLESLKYGNSPILSDIETVAKFLNEIDTSFASYSSLIKQHESLKETASCLENDVKKWRERANFYQEQNKQYQSIQIFQDNPNDLRRNNERLSQENQVLRSNNTLLQNQVTSIERERDTLKNERDELENERGRMLRDLAAKNQDKNTTYTISIDRHNKPQHHTLYQEFKQLKDQEFNAFSKEMFFYLSEQELVLKANRKQEIAKIKSVLSKQVIIDGMKLFTGTSDFSDEIEENALKTVSQSFRTAAGIAENVEMSETLSNELENLIKQGMKLLNETSSSGTSKRFRNQEEFTTVVKDISTSIYNALKISEEKEIPEKIRIDTENLVQKGLELVRKIASADPPGILWIEKEGIPFKSDRHEAILGCEEGGKILLTVYPGYMVGDRVFEKALVFTVS
ncbi:MAG: hypothetical protein SAK29_01375 [Scytonema sp. PMC 1069.18]|nr:hypothetical protein [Scytonema sp. PMC 1069.18]MEC4880157.1 hypothetical protein [Scytonema sp. PMC 1070.18]